MLLNLDRGLTFRLDWGRGPFRVSEEREALRLKIVADPYDDDLRRVYADMAIEEGDPRGEYVRLGLLLDGEEDDARARELERAMEDLRARYGRAIFAEWFGSILSKELPFLLRDHGPIHRKAHGTNQRAGFISALHLSRRGAEYIREAFALTPVESATFPGDQSGVEHSIGKVRDFRSPTVALFEKFAVRPRRVSAVGVRDLAALLRAAPYGDLRSLRLVASEADDEAIATLVKSAPRLHSLGHLRVSARGARLLTELPLRELEMTLAEDVTLDEDAFQQLETLTLGGAYESLGALIARREVRTLELYTSPTPRFLEMLDGAPLTSLTLRSVNEATLPALAKLSLPKLTHLCLTPRPVGATANAIIDAPFASTLRSLEIFHGQLSGEELARLIESDVFAGLETLNLSGNPIGSTGANALAGSPHATKIKSLKLGGARIGQGAMRALMEQLHSLEVFHLHVNNKKLRGLPVFAIAEMPHLNRVREIAAEGGGGGSSQDALIALAGSANARSLRRLSVGTITANAMRALIASPHLEALGEIGEFKPRGDDALYHRAQRRFGHRLRTAYALRRDLPEPDLDPWWTPL